MLPAAPLLLTMISSPWAATPGGFRAPGDGASGLVSTRVAAVINPGDEQILGAVLEGEALLGPIQVGASTGYTLALRGGDGLVDRGLGQTALTLLFPLEGRGEWSTRVGGMIGGTPGGSLAYSTVSSEVTPGGLIAGVLHVHREDDTSATVARVVGGAAWRSAGLSGAGEDGVTTSYLESQLFYAHQLRGPVWAGLETELMLTDRTPLSFRPLLRARPAEGLAVDLGLNVPLHWLPYAVHFPSAATVLARVTLWAD